MNPVGDATLGALRASLPGTRMRWIFAVGSACLVLNACEFTTMTDRVRIRAANEFNCDVEKVEVESLGSNGYHAKGCGQGGTFVCSGDPSGSEGHTCVRQKK